MTFCIVTARNKRKTCKFSFAHSPTPKSLRRRAQMDKLAYQAQYEEGVTAGNNKLDPASALGILRGVYAPD